MKVKLSLELSLTDEHIEEIIEGAGYVQHSWNLGGTIDTENRTFQCTVDDGDELIEKSVTFDEIAKAVETIAVTNRNVMLDLVLCYMDGNLGGEMDAMDYDEIIQVALFGDVVYG
jgi:hypothetical protein